MVGAIYVSKYPILTLCKATVPCRGTVAQSAERLSKVSQPGATLPWVRITSQHKEAGEKIQAVPSVRQRADINALLEK